MIQQQVPENGEVTVIERFWAVLDLDEQEYLDRLASFGEGYFDLSMFLGDESSYNQN